MGATTAKSDLDANYRRAVRDWLVSVQAEHGLETQAALARAMGRDRTIATRYLKMQVRPDYSALVSLADTTGAPIPAAVETAWRRVEGLSPAPSKPTSGTGAAKRAIRSMPIISFVAAGHQSDPTTQIGSEHQTLEINGLPPGDYFATRVQGTSMNRVSPPGSLIVVNRAERELIRGRRYIFSYRGETTYKRYESTPARLEPETTDPESNPTIFPRNDEDWTVIGRVRLTLLDDL